MPNPTGEDRVSVPLTNISVAFMQSQTQFVSMAAFPVVNVNKQTDKYYTWPLADWFRDELQPRGDEQESAGSGMRLSSDSYMCDVYALHKDIGSQARANLENEVNLERATVQWLTGRAMLKQEKTWAANYFVTGVWGTSATPSNLWSNYATSTPLEDIEVGRRSILLKTGMRANLLILGYDVFAKLKNHPDIIDRFKYTSAEVVTTALLARLFEVERVLVAEGIENTANEGLTEVMTFTHGKHALLCYAPPAPGLETPSAGYTFHWTGDQNNVSQGLGEAVGVRNFYIPERKVDRYEIECAYDQKVVSASLGYFFESVVV